MARPKEKLFVRVNVDESGQHSYITLRRPVTGVNQKRKIEGNEIKQIINA